MNNLNPEIEAYIIEKLRANGNLTNTNRLIFGCDDYKSFSVLQDDYGLGLCYFRVENNELYSMLVCQFIIPETLEEFKTICQILKVWQ